MIETDMFLTVPVKEKASCQNFPERLRRFREAQFLPLSEKILKSYLNDLYIAKNSDENLMTYKYARMDDLIKPKSINPLIKKIMILQLNWQFDFFRMYPEFGKKARPVSNSNDTDYQTSFETYLSCEL